MNTNLPYKKLVIAASVLILLGLALLFRERISQLLVLRQQPITMPTPLPPAVPTPSPIVQNPSPTGSGQQVNPPAKTPAYTGRDPAEVRPVPEEVKLFSDSQKKNLYAKIQEYGNAVKKNPYFFEAWVDIGVLKKNIGDFEGAKDAWEYGGLIQPSNSLTFSNLGELYWRYLTDYPKAEKNLKIAIAHKPTDPQNYITLAELYHYSYKEKVDLADDALLDGLKALPSDQSLMRRLAYLYEQRQEWKSALEWWKKVQTLRPDDQEVSKKVSTLTEKVGT